MAAGDHGQHSNVIYPFSLKSADFHQILYDSTGGILDLMP